MRALRKRIGRPAALLALALAGGLAAAPAGPAGSRRLAFDHVWIVVSEGAPERKSLEGAGFHVAPTVNRNDGSGTSSISVELLNGYLELMWPDPSVSVAPGRERGPEKFRRRMNWRTSGSCPFGIGLHRIGSSNDPLPLPAWEIRAPWMRPGTAIEVLSPRDDTSGPAVFVEPAYLAVDAAANEKTESIAPPSGDVFRHPSGARRITAVRLVLPKGFQAGPEVGLLESNGIAALGRGEEWLVELTLDGGARKKTADLRPALPLVLRY